MKGFLKKLATFTLSAAMILTMGAIPAFAATTGTADSVKGSVTGVKDAESVIAYKIIGYDSDTPTGLEDLTTGDVIRDNGNPPKAVNEKGFQVDNINWSTVPDTAITGGTAVRLSEETEGTWSGNFTDPGFYKVIITNKDGVDTQYNPMTIGIEKNNGVLVSTDTQAKPSTTTIKKEASKANDTKDPTGNDLEVNDIVDFTVTTTIPTYKNGVETKDVTFLISDTLSKGLTYVNETGHETYYTVGGQRLTGNNTPVVDVTSKTENAGQEQKLTLDLHSIVLAHPGEQVVLHYSAKLNSEAVTNANPNTNTVTLTYKNGPDEETHYAVDRTNHYTFEIDSGIDGNNKEEHYDVLKSGDRELVNEITKKKALPGAVFNLYTTLDAARNASVNDNASTPGYFNTATTGADGRMNFKDLDGNKYYYLVEVSAPNGYVKSNDVIRVMAHPTYGDGVDKIEVGKDADGNSIYGNANVKRLTSYYFSWEKATKNDDGTLSGFGTLAESQHYSYEYKTDANTIGTVIDNDKSKTTGESYEIMNTKTPNLPSTGGMGTYLFTIAGVAIIVFAGVLLARGRKRRQNS